jgi:hypothetical protein
MRADARQGGKVKKYALIAAVMIGGTGLCHGQGATADAEMADGLNPDMMEETNPFEITGGFIYKNWIFHHDGLQARVPASSQLADEWRDGDSGGTGWGVQASIGRGDGQIDVSFTKSNVSYKLEKENYRSKVDTVVRDLEVSWSQVRGRAKNSEWGSTLGFRYFGTQKDMIEAEGASRHPFVESGNINWVMLLGGYNGKWRPFDTDMIEAYGALLLFLAEADGPARQGGDENWTNDNIAETYDNEHSLAYGFRGSFGADIALTKRVRLTIEYLREWLYSFDAADTGIVVFPDNGDALFIENQYAVKMAVNYLF